MPNGGLAAALLMAPLAHAEFQNGGFEQDWTGWEAPVPLRRPTTDMATFGPGSSPHFYGTLFQKATQVAAEPIAYKGSGDAAKDMLAGRIDYMFDSMTTAIANVKAEKLVALAITSPQRSPLLPDVPTLKELGYGAADVNFWLTLQVPAKTPTEMVAALRQAVSKAVQDPEYKHNVAARGVENLYVAPERLDAFFVSETKKWRDTALSIGIKPE